MKAPMAHDPLLGELIDFGTLPPGVRTAHTPPLRAKGEFRVRSKAVARLWNLPRTGAAVPTPVVVTQEGDAQRWQRSFGDQRLTTRQWVENGLLTEANGPGRIAMRVSPCTDGVHYETVRAWLGPFRVLWYLHVEAEVGEAEGGWTIDVRVRWWPFGIICQYSGMLRPE